MGGLKCILCYFVIYTCIRNIDSESSNKRISRNVNMQGLPAYGYPIGYQYPPISPYQPYQPYQPAYGAPMMPMTGGVPFYPPYKGYQGYPYYMNPMYNPYASPIYSPYQSYPQNSFYPSFPYPNLQPSLGNGDPYANLPTEIIDMDQNGTDITEPILSEDMPELTLSQSGFGTGPSGQPLMPYYLSNVVTTKPVLTTITRTFDAKSSDPVIDIQYPQSNSGSGVLIQVDENSAKTESNVSDNEENNIEESNEFMNMFS